MRNSRQFQGSSIGSNASRNVEELVQRSAGGKWSAAVGKMHQGDVSLEKPLGKKETITKIASVDYSRARNAGARRAAMTERSRLQHFINNRDYDSEKKLGLSQRLGHVGIFGGAF